LRGGRFQKGHTPWNKLKRPTKQELERLYWEEGFSVKEIANMLGVGQSTVYKWMKDYGIPRGRDFKMEKWSQKEIEKLRRVYPISSRSEVEAHFPNRTWESIRYMAKKLGLRLKYRRENQWRENEIEFIKRNYDKMTDEEIGRKLGRTAMAVQAKRLQLGLTKGYNMDITKPSRKLELSEVDKAYLAGLIDGDGSIILSYHRYPSRKGSSGIHSQISCAISVRSANREFAEEVMRMLGGRIVKIEENYYEVGISRLADILQLLEALLPYLRLKRKQAEIMIEFCKERLRVLKHRRNAPYTPKCFELVDRMKALNRTPMSEREWR